MSINTGILKITCDIFRRNAPPPYTDAPQYNTHPNTATSAINPYYIPESSTMKNVQYYPTVNAVDYHQMETRGNDYNNYPENAYYNGSTSYPYQQQQQQPYQPPETRKYQYKSSRGLIGNVIGFAANGLSNATAKAASKTDNDANKAILNIGGLIEDRLSKKDQRKMEKKMNREYRRGHKHDRSPSPSYGSSSSNPPAPHAPYGS